MNKCVYIHVALNNIDLHDRKFIKNQIVYIGSGSLYRVTEKASRSEQHIQIWDSLQKIVVFNNLSQEEARTLEQELINVVWKFGLLNKLQKVAKAINYSYEFLSQYLHLDEEFKLRWSVDRFSGRKHSRKHISKGDLAGHRNLNTGYGTVLVDNTVLQYSRVVYCLHYKVDIPDNLIIDHLDNNPLNDNPLNLKLKTPSENNLNRPSMKISNCNHRGIHESGGKFRVQWYENGDRLQKDFRYSRVGRMGHLTREEALKQAVDFNVEKRKEIYGLADMNT